MSDNDSLIDQDLVDESNEGLTNVFQDYNDDDFDLDLFQENDDDDQHRVYVSDAFQGTSATKWRHERENAKCIDFNGAEKDLLIGMKAVEGARAVFFASQKVNNVPSYAMCYRNGSKGVGNIHSTLPFLGVWDLVLKTDQ